MEASGQAERAIPVLLAMALPAPAKAQIARLAETVAVLRAARPDLLLTVDPVEFRGYQYLTGICMTVFAAGEEAELGRGGRYLCDSEPATGITLYPDTIIRLAPRPKLRPRLYLPFGTPAADAAAARAQNFATINGLAPHPDPRAEAHRLGCSHAFSDGQIVPLA